MNRRRSAAPPARKGNNPARGGASEQFQNVVLCHADIVYRLAHRLAGSPHEVVFSARSIRQHAEAGERVPVVVFCIEGIDEGDEIEIGENVHLTRPDNFNQLRSLIARLLNRISIAA